uniref:Uncharacterized protein n=1 Tax=Utricularia reniformis TaxID=192314 RepID=A0A1Y0B256_9LAMI|nr:hypothetical protein AEK19_MT1271 [Utricularia reniformis]ART31477.1 hypothetical protein AEK19_MT1271 [Utricularia reniformis]
MYTIVIPICSLLWWNSATLSERKYESPPGRME